MHGPSPTSNFCRDTVPHSPLSLRPCIHTCIYIYIQEYNCKYIHIYKHTYNALHTIIFMYASMYTRIHASATRTHFYACILHAYYMGCIWVLEEFYWWRSGADCQDEI